MRNILKRNKVEVRGNVASKLPFEAIHGTSNKYQDILVKGKYYNYNDDYSRKEVALNDAIMDRVTLGFLKIIFQKLPKFVRNDEITPEYIMEDVRDSIDTLNLKPKFIMVGTNLVINGWCLVDWDVTENSLKCKIFGYEECHPRYWYRYNQHPLVNVIRWYRAIYVPRPVGMEPHGTTLSEERFHFIPSDPTFQHLTRIDYNKGYGYSRVQPIWDAITKLRESSDAQHFLNSNFMQIRYPQSWKSTGKAQKFAEKARKATSTKGLAMEAVTNPQTNEDTGLPSVQFRPWGQGPQGQKMDTNAASAYLDGEWLRLLVNLGYSQSWAVGAAAGAVEGSEIGLTRDDRADISEWTQLEPVFKNILKRLAELGVMEKIGVSGESIQLLLTKKYHMVSWLTWEYNDKAALQQEQLDHDLEMQKGKSDDRNDFGNKSNELLRENAAARHNARVEQQLLYAIITNTAMPMTPVMSSWIKKIGFEDNEIYMQTHDGGKYSKPRGDAEQQYQQWTSSGSKGGYFWDNFADRAPPWQKVGAFPENLEAGFGKDVGITEGTQEFKMEGEQETGTPGLGTSRDVYHIGDTDPDSTPLYNPTTKPAVDPSTASTTQEYNPTDQPFAFAETAKGKGRPRSPGRKDPGHVSRKIERESNPYGKTNPYPITYNKKFMEVLNSKSGLQNFAKNISTDHLPTGWSMNSSTPYRIKELVAELVKATVRVNRVSFGNSVKAGHPYNYGGEDEFICPKSYKVNIGKTVPLGIYHNQDTPGEVTLPEWQIIGTHEVLGWDDELGQELARNEYDENKINDFFEMRGEENWIQPYFDAGEEPPISGAYTTLPVKHNGKIFQVKINLKSMSFVPDGNCPWSICNFKPEVIN